MLSRLAITVLILSTSLASADFIYLVEDGPWTIGGGKTRCQAVNRVPVEVNYVPINALFLLEDEKRQPVIRIVFWPGALPEQVSQVNFTVNGFDGPLSFTVPAKIGNPEWYDVETSAPLPKEMIRLLESGRMLLSMDVEVPGTKAKTIFSLESIQSAFMNLHSCVSAIENSKK